MNFEDDIPGVECRPENARTRLLEARGSDDVTLEEVAKKEPVVKPEVKEVKRRRSTVTKNKAGDEAAAEPEEAPKPRKRGRKKKEEDDEEYVPESEKKASTATKKSPKKELKTGIVEEAMKAATLDEMSEVMVEEVETKQILAHHKIPEGLKIVNIEQPIVKVEAPKPKPPEAKSTAGQTLSKATITPVPAPPPKPANSGDAARTSAQAPKAPEVVKSASTPSSSTGGTTPRVVSKQGSHVR